MLLIKLRESALRNKGLDARLLKVGEMESKRKRSQTEYQQSPVRTESFLDGKAWP